MKKPIDNAITRAMQAKAGNAVQGKAKAAAKQANVNVSEIQGGDDAPKIEFPCAYPVRIMGDAHDSFVDDVFAIMLKHAPEIQRQHVKTRPSSKGTFVSVHIVIQATGEQQLIDIHAELKSYSSVKMVI